MALGARTAQFLKLLAHPRPLHRRTRGAPASGAAPQHARAPGRGPLPSRRRRVLASTASAALRLPRHSAPRPARTAALQEPRAGWFKIGIAGVCQPRSRSGLWLPSTKNWFAGDCSAISRDDSDVDELLHTVYVHFLMERTKRR